MYTAVAVEELTTERESPPAKPLDEAVWQAWKAKGREQDRRRYVIGGVFAGLVLLSSPVGPVYRLADTWQRALTAGSAIPFAVSLAWGDRKAAYVD